MTGFQPPIPILRSFDEKMARALYIDFLGFTVQFEHRFGAGAPLYMGIERDGCVLQLSEHFGHGTPGTFVRIEVPDVERDLSNVKTGIANFITSYNELRQELNFQLNVDPTSGAPDEDAVLFGNSALEEMDRRLEAIVGGGADGVSSAFSVLAQIGIDFIANGDLEDPTLRDTLELNEEQLDEALLNNLDDVQKLFQFDFAASDPRVVLLGFDGNSTHSAAGYTMDIDYDEGGGAINSLTMSDGAATAEREHDHHRQRRC